MSREDGLAVVEAHRARLAALPVDGFHLHGSLALGGYHHGISDIDLVVTLARPLTDDERSRVSNSHAQAGPLLSAAYVVDREDPEAEHSTWTHGWSGTRRVSLITRAELHEVDPQTWPPVPDLPAVVAAEVHRAWARELRVPRTWLRTEYVDLGLTSVARAHLTQRSGRLTSKDDAIAALPALGVPLRLATAVAERREGREALPHNRIARAVSARSQVRRLLQEL